MAMQTLQPPGKGQHGNSQSSSNTSFAKALLEAGGNSVESTVDAGVQFAQDALGQLFGQSSPNPSASNQNQNNEQMQANPSGNPDWGWNAEAHEKEWKNREKLLLRHREINQINVYDARQVETDKKINEILKLLAALSDDLSDTYESAKAAKTAVIQGVVQPGAYHITFLEKLLKIIILLRQRVKESASWLASLNSRKTQQQGYWDNFYRQGTTWSMSQERTLATSGG